MKVVFLQSVRYGVILGAIAAAIYALILARAAALYSQDTAVSVAAALRLQPRNSNYLDRLASWQPEDRQSLLQRSVAEDPFNYDAWIRLGFMAEMQDGDNVAAERYYLKAAQVNHMFLPRWTLANFYFRQQQRVQFFHWSREALVVTPYASEPVFAQMWQMSDDDETLNAVIPDRPRILLQYAWYLSNTKRFACIPRVVERLVQTVGKDDPAKWGKDDLLAVAMDQMLAAGEVRPALNVWSTLKSAGWLEQAVPNDQRPLTNGNFGLRFYRHGFDWAANENSGTMLEEYPDSQELHISLYGDEGEKITLLQQYVPLAPGAHYAMEWHIQGEELSLPSGLAWHLHPVKGEAATELVSGDVLAGNKSWEFTAQPKAKAFLLTLEYIRPLGVTRARGAIALKSVAINRK